MRTRSSCILRKWTEAIRSVAPAILILLVSPTIAFALEPVSVRLDYLPGADHAPIFLAFARGYYKDEGLEVEIRDGTGSVATVQTVGSGADLIGLASLTTMTLSIPKGVPLVAVAGIIQKTPNSVISLSGSGILKPKDVEGKRWGFSPDDAGRLLFEAFAAANGVDIDKVIKVQVSSRVVFSALLNGNVDFITAWSSPDGFKIAKQKPIEPPLMFADYGVNTLGTGIIVSKDTAAKRGDLVRAFLRATVRGAEETEKNPDAAIDAIVAMRPNSDRAILAEEYGHLHEFLHTKNSDGHVYGWMAPADWAQTRDILIKYFELPASIQTTDLYTDDFLPQH